MRLLEFLKDLEKVQETIMQYPNYFVQIKGLSIDKIPIIVTEYLDQKDLQQYYQNYKISLQSKIALVVQITEAMACLHSDSNMSLVHGRFKPQNILVSSEEKIKICYLQNKNTLDGSKEEIGSLATSTLFYTSPELLENNNPQQGNDI